MKSFVSALGMATAAFAVVGSANAADLPSRKAAPVEYVRVCSAFGAGFFYIPGTDTCLRVGGRVRAEYTFGERWNAAQDTYGTRARGRIYVDARNQTAYGTLRTFVRYDMTTSTGSYRYSGTNPGANRFSLVSGVNEDSAPSLDRAFVQFGPITAGKSQSFFDFYANDLGFSVVRTSDRAPTLLAYTATFGGGFSATISLEDPKTTGRVGSGDDTFPYKGTAYPDVVGSLRVEQGWGAAQLSAAFGDRGVYRSPYLAANQVLLSLPGAQTKDGETGWAVQGGVKLNLPMLAAGDLLFLQAGYADGALEYLGWGTAGYGHLPRYTVVNFGEDVNGHTKSNTGFNLVAGLRHFWTPTIRSDIYGSYSELKTHEVAVENNRIVARSFDPKETIVGANLVWSPVANLDLGVEVLYSRTEYGFRNPDAKVAAAPGNLPKRLIKSDDAWTGRLRIQREF